MVALPPLTVPAAADRIRTLDPQLHAFVSTRLEAALHDAQARAAEPPRSLLHGLPYALKDEWDTRCLPTTGGSYRHRDRVPARDSAVFQVLDAAGAVLLGKSSLSDLGLAPEAANYLVGPTRNPHDATRTAGGSSGGAAAAVASRMVAFDWGTDIGGSIRLPAAFCGVPGLRLSSATWPITGLFPTVPPALSWMCGQGPIAGSLALLRQVLRVARPRLRTGPARAFELRGLSVYSPDHPGAWPTFAADVAPVLARATSGPVAVDPALPGTTEVMRVYAGVWASHLEQLLVADPSIPSLAWALGAVAASLLLRGRLGDRRFHPQCAELLALMALGRVTLYRDPARALARARAVQAAFERCWDQGQIVVAPVCTEPPPRVGTSNLHPHLLDCTVAGNLADATGLAIPCGRFGHLPRGIQLLGPPGSEEILLDLGPRLMW
jgi:Asp-tRNA(Asn)/Glu-tRNA(Gln) amidotransferase A subunit family amidase